MYFAGREGAHFAGRARAMDRTGSLAPQVGLEPTTLRLTVGAKGFPIFYFSLLYCPIFNRLRSIPVSTLYPRFRCFSNESPHRSPHNLDPLSGEAKWSRRWDHVMLEEARTPQPCLV